MMEVNIFAATTIRLIIYLIRSRVITDQKMYELETIRQVMALKQDLAGGLTTDADGTKVLIVDEYDPDELAQVAEDHLETNV